MICPLCSGSLMFMNGHKVCTNCGAIAPEPQKPEPPPTNREPRVVVVVPAAEPSVNDTVQDPGPPQSAAEAKCPAETCGCGTPATPQGNCVLWGCAKHRHQPDKYDEAVRKARSDADQIQEQIRAGFDNGLDIARDIVRGADQIADALRRYARMVRGR